MSDTFEQLLLEFNGMVASTIIADQAVVAFLESLALLLQTGPTEAHCLEAAALCYDTIAGMHDSIARRQELLP